MCYAPVPRLQTQQWLTDKTTHFGWHWVVILNLTVCTFEQSLVVSFHTLKTKKEKQKRKWHTAAVLRSWHFIPVGVKEGSHLWFCGTTLTRQHCFYDMHNHVCASTPTYYYNKFPKFRNNIEKKKKDHFSFPCRFSYTHRKVQNSISLKMTFVSIFLKKEVKSFFHIVPEMPLKLFFWVRRICHTDCEIDNPNVTHNPTLSCLFVFSSMTTLSQDVLSTYVK